MLKITLTLMLTLTVSLMTMTLMNILSKKMSNDREKKSPFECGFDPSSSARIPFSLQFFLIAVMFLIFDIEIALMLPLIVSMKITKMVTFSFISTSFLVILLMGLYHEWNQGTMTWTK